MSDKITDQIPSTEKPPLKDIKDSLNERFRSGVQAWEVIENLRSIDKPILVDFNGVLANNEEPPKLNPKAPKFLAELRKIGNIIIVTTATNWEAVQSSLKGYGLWSDEDVLMVKSNWGFIAEYNPNLNTDRSQNPHGVNLIGKFIEFKKSQGLIVAESQFRNDYHFKRLAPLFLKEYDIPLIDNNASAVLNNPGISGIITKPFAPEDLMLMSQLQNAPGLMEAVEKVKKVYA